MPLLVGHCVLLSHSLTWHLGEQWWLPLPLYLPVSLLKAISTNIFFFLLYAGCYLSLTLIDSHISVPIQFVVMAFRKGMVLRSSYPFRCCSLFLKFVGLKSWLLVYGAPTFGSDMNLSIHPCIHPLTRRSQVLCFTLKFCCFNLSHCHTLQNLAILYYIPYITEY